MQTNGTNTAGNVVLGGQATGNGTYLLAGGVLIAQGVGGGPGISTFDFNGGTLQPSADNATFLQSLTSAVVQSGGALVDTNGKNVVIAQNLLHDSSLGASADGGLVKSGAGAMTLSGGKHLQRRRHGRRRHADGDDRRLSRAPAPSP